MPQEIIVFINIDWILLDPYRVGFLGPTKDTTPPSAWYKASNNVIGTFSGLVDNTPVFLSWGETMYTFGI